MCGIAGIIYSQHNAEANGYMLKEKLQLMNTAIQHRGPDGEKVWISNDGAAGFAHRRLAIIDLSAAAAQPMHYMQRYTIVHNGEIYNYKELRDELTKKGYQFNTQSDTEVILAAYDCYKEQCVQHFDGMFAFGIWDETEKSVFAARDRFGEKPFFYFSDKQQFVFASEMKALWAAGVRRDVNQNMLFNFITIGYTDNPNDPDETFFEKISRLPPASWLKFGQGDTEITIEKYWDIDLDNENNVIKDGEAIEQFNFLLKQSAEKRLRSDVEIGTSLSGGLDSSSIVSVCAALQNDNKNQKAFTASFPGFEKDEKHFAELVAKKFNLNHIIITPGADDFAENFVRMMYHNEEPVTSASVYAQYCVYKKASGEGIKVMMDGQGADEILAGYHKHYKWYWQELFRKRKLLKSKELNFAKALGVKESFTYKNIIASFFPGVAAAVLENRYLANAIRHPYLTKEFVKYYSGEAYYTTPDIFRLKGALYFDTCIHGLNELLRYADRNSMAHGCEVRLPFLNHQLVEFIFSLPPNFKIREGWTKWLLRKSMTEKLPDEITWRKDKTGFEPPQKNWMETKRVQEMIMASKEKLINEKILIPGVKETARPHDAYEAGQFEWRYFAAGALF